MATLILHGDLQRFGRVHTLRVAHPAEAIHALICQLDGFKRRLLDGRFFVYVEQTQLDGRNGIPELRRPIAADATIHLVPAIAGAGGNSGLFSLFAGIVLIVAGVFTFGSTTAIGMGMIGAGIGLTAAGAMSLMVKAPTPPETSPGQEHQPSTSFGGFGNGAATGATIPVVLGTIRAGSKVLSQGVETYNTYDPTSSELSGEALKKVLTASLGPQPRKA